MSKSGIPASIWCFLAEASSGVSPALVLNTTGAFEIDPGVAAAVGSKRFAYRDSPRAGVEEFDMTGCWLQQEGELSGDLNNVNGFSLVT